MISVHDSTYSEAHHIRPLGSPHNGPDIAENILVLCPNHHVMCDYGSIHLYLKNLHVHSRHCIGAPFIEYHNTVIAKLDFIHLKQKRKQRKLKQIFAKI